MDKDQQLIQRSVTRRQSIQLLGIAAAVTCVKPLFAASSATSANETCILTPKFTVGPYYVDGEKIRSDITESKPGLPLLLRITVLDAQRCTPLRNAAVDIWHCDARGYYSGYTAQDPDSNSFMKPKDEPQRESRDGPPRGYDPNATPNFAGPTDQLTFFRGIQFANARGVVEFKTIYPGWYFSRDIHIHLRVHADGTAQQGKYSGGHVCHTGQLAFSDEISDQVATLPPYQGRTLRRTRLEEDTVFSADSLSQSLVKLTQTKRDIAAGFIGEAMLVIDPTATPKDVGMFGPGMVGRRPPGDAGGG